MEDRYNVLCTQRVRFAGAIITPGSIIHLTRLSTAAHLCRTKQCRPADERTAIEVELAELLRRAVPAADGSG